MTNVAGVFTSKEGVLCAVQKLRGAGFTENSINALAPGSTQSELEHKVAVSDTEQPGMGSAMGGVVGGAVGAAGGLELGIAAASLLIPGVGPVVVGGIVAAALFGAGGAALGAMAGGAMEESIGGTPHDELFVYEDALRRGRGVVFVTAADDAQSGSAKRVLHECGAESVDKAREEWWVGLRDDEKQYYDSTGGSFQADEAKYRNGFESALHPSARGKSYEEDLERLRSCHGGDCDHTAFKAGYSRAREYESRLKEKYRG